MDDDKLNPFQENELKWLRRQVDRLQDEKYKTDTEQYNRRLNIERELWSAKEELSNFVKNLRKAGKQI
jgi:hypothetical protein